MTVKNGKFDICTECGAHLDPGEKCDCEEEHFGKSRGMTLEEEKKTTMSIRPVTGEPFCKTGEWTYKPEYRCWYCDGASYPAEICEVAEE